MRKPIFEKKNIIVTGGAGFIGSHLCHELVKKNLVICIDDLSGGDERNIDSLLALSNFRFIKHDLSEKIVLEERVELNDLDLKYQGIQEIYHLAAIMSPKKFESAKLEIINNNLDVTRNCLDIAAKYKSKFLFASSSVVYGKRPDNRTFFQEDYFGYVDPISPRACYDEGKRCAETLVSVYEEKFGLDAKIARIFRTYGPNERLREGHMIPDFITSALEGKPLIIYGSKDFSTSLCYVSDIVDGIVKLMDIEQDIGPVNLGSDQFFTLNDVAKRIIEIAKDFSPEAAKSEIVFEDPLLFMSPLGLPSIVKAKEKLFWLPIITLNKGLRNMVDYVMANKDILEMKFE